MTNTPRNDRSCRTRGGDSGFTVVEVVIAALLLALVIVGATAMFGSTQRTGSTTKVRDKQTALGTQVMSTLQADPSWAPWCRTRPNPNNCDLAAWMQQQPALSTMGTVRDGSQTIQFRIIAVATGVDLAADGLGRNDEDGVVPDVYRLKVTIAPDPALARRIPNLAPFVTQSDVNPSIRVESGQVVIDVCVARNQVDERIAVGDCTGGPNSLNVLPPPGLDTSSTGAIGNTCDGPSSATVGAAERDCVAFKCADVEISRLGDRGLNTDCPSYPGWTPPATGGWEAFLTKVAIDAASGTIRLRNVKTGQVSPARSLVNGRAEFRDLPVGEYDVLANINGANRLWRSKSVPSTQKVAIEPGLRSRAVLMYRPSATGRISIPVRSVDGSIPWEPREWDSWISIDKSGGIQQSQQPIEMCLVPVPQGRLHEDDVPCQEFAQNMGTTQFDFTNVEPGLYSAQISYRGYTSFLPLSGTAGFMWIPEGGNGIVKLNDSSATFEYVNGMCAEYVRDSIIGQTNPETGTVVTQRCNSPAGGGGPGGSGGGGTQ